MSKFTIRFISSNQFKLSESEKILNPIGVTIIPINIKIEEIQTEDTQTLLKDKALKAFRKVGHPLFVEHTGLYINHLNGLPGGLTQIFWDKLEADRFSAIFGNMSDNSVSAKTIIGYIDGKKFHSFEGEISGKISDTPRGDKSFQWDCAFIPESETRTFSEMGEEKNKISMRKLALDKFANYLNSQGIA
ncbi:non-canonical purine NTP pyrophosphatase [Chitinispirillales bacterium ANBcel5]|uniref:non-canonical purine NTP pyrophosphatase n=1 Tax=Cellulosispirillum alkaliphilum TaxID=3039283 RepID=UPI002A4F1C4F|nr:non-canonical purine NTP pyrophosphatase [Chitinispirillales bacterium ANBcel5]